MVQWVLDTRMWTVRTMSLQEEELKKPKENLVHSCFSAIISKVRGSRQHFVVFKDISVSLGVMH